MVYNSKMRLDKGYEKYFQKNVLVCEVIRSYLEVGSSHFFSENNASLQMGVLKHSSGFIEVPHYHPVIDRGECATQQFFYVISGKVCVNFYDKAGRPDYQIVLEPGDSINILDGIHAIQILESSKCISIKQGPFLGEKMDKVEVTFDDSCF